MHGRDGTWQQLLRALPQNDHARAAPLEPVGRRGEEHPDPLLLVGVVPGLREVRPKQLETGPMELHVDWTRAREGEVWRLLFGAFK